MSDWVYNVVGTASRKCQCTRGPRNWLAHWQRGTGLPLPLKCVAKYCARYVEVGAHVKLWGYDQRIIWIIPFCQYHNMRPSIELIQLKYDVMLCGAARVDCE